MLHLWQIMNPPASDDLIPPDNTPTEIANGRLDAIRRNAAADYEQAQQELLSSTRQEARKSKKVAVHLAADRLALYRTLQFIESRWKEGASAEQTLSEAQDFRSKEYNNVMNDSLTQHKIKDGIATVPDNDDAIKHVLVDSLPVGKGKSPPRAYRPSGPAKR